MIDRPCPPRAAAGMLLAVGSAQGADAITFVRMVRDEGIRAEANPLVAHLASFGDLLPILLLKVALVLFVVAVFALMVRWYPIGGALVCTVAVVAGIVGAYSNVAVIVGSAGRLLPL